MHTVGSTLIVWRPKVPPNGPLEAPSPATAVPWQRALRAIERRALSTLTAAAGLELSRAATPPIERAAGPTRRRGPYHHCPHRGLHRWLRPLPVAGFRVAFAALSPSPAASRPQHP
jgi:hypothetical protein